MPEFLSKAALVVALVTLAGLLVAVVVLAAKVFFAIFSGLLLATFLLALRDGLSRHTFLTPGWALAGVILILALLFGAGLVVLAPQLAKQAEEFGERIPGLISRSEAFLREYGWGRQIVQNLRGGEMIEGIQGGVIPFFSATVEGLGLLVTFVAVGLFIAVNPGLYYEGLIRLLPIPWRGRARQVFGEIGHTLRWFLVARAIAMFLVGLSTTVVLMLLNIPLALLLGVVAGLLTFALYLGPIAAGVPIVLVAFMESPEKALYVLILYSVIQNIEGVLFDPLILQRVIRLAPVVTLGSQMLAGFLLGPLGIALATPFAAVVQVLVRRVYREDILGENRSSHQTEK